ncbi:unnamed protein product (macronuclear) [Paramecium tetraurelia]|uniref:Uncharacterized protein n=1 Tax=Paramecium tetraurelia TaxID=5888 RepID=A0CJK8_PARTE|nr:uncharacterized protein GSPATT00000687001 [Paramecium tetraurelia]CAK70975.1 unnamed protein product [Paramecium tetraurelia]|eukprot:XP_001438372.1 hypothetical protein (macronuclear) [Paramecium tetraurelia strain d4-2]
MQSNYKIEGRKSPKTIVGLQQKINQYFSNKIQEKQIVADIISRPQLEEIIPCSIKVNISQMKYSNAHNPLHQKQLYNTEKTEKNKQIKYHTSRSNTSNQCNRDQKSQKANKKNECCSCFCFGCSKRNSTRIKKPRTPQVKGEQYYVNYTNKTSESNQAIKQYSIAKSQSRCVQHQIRHHQSEQRKQNIHPNCCKINHLANPKLSQAISQYSESAKQYYTQREYIQIQKQLQNYCDAKKRYSSTKEQKQKEALKTHIQKIEEGKFGQPRVQKLCQFYKDITKKQMIKFRSSSNQNKIYVQQEQKHMNYKTIEKGKQITKLGQSEKDKKKFKQVLDIFKKNKMQNNIIKNNNDILQNNPEQNQIEKKVSCQQIKFESKQKEKTFQNNEPYQLVELK